MIDFMHLNGKRLAVLTALALISANGATHHSGALYDESSVTFQGTVAKVRWANPHVIVEIDVAERGGEVSRWSVEGLPPAGLRRVGWTKDSLGPGDSVMVSGNPARNSQRKLMLGASIVLSDGSVLKMPNMRRPDGQQPVDLENPVAARSLSGLWVTRWNPETASEFFGARSKWSLTDSARAAMDSYDSTMDPGARCVPEPIPYVMIFPAAKQIDIGDEVTTIRDEVGMDRTVHMSVDSHDGANHSDQGHSIGKWDGEVLVVDTTHFSDHRRGLAFAGLPSGEGKHLVERFELSEDKTSLNYSFVLEDPEYLEEPVSGQLDLVHRPDIQFMSEDCDIDNASEHLDDPSE